MLFAMALLQSVDGIHRLAHITNRQLHRRPAAAAHHADAAAVYPPGPLGAGVDDAHLAAVALNAIHPHASSPGTARWFRHRQHRPRLLPIFFRRPAPVGPERLYLRLHGTLYGPGLVGALLVGVAEAKAIAYAKKKPLVGVHHIEGHVSANYIEHPDLEPPFLCEIISGGHTHLVIVKDYGSFEILGRTRDDAAGEAFDKVARAIGLGYPGGPKIDKLAKEGNPHAIDFPRAHMEDAPYDFSFSGVKSAVLNHLNKCRMTGEPIVEADIAASFQQAVVDVLVDNAIRAAKDYHMDRLAIAGGVASNGALRAAMEAACEKEGIRFYRPSPIFCTDNAAMIGVAAYYEYQKGTRHGWDLNAVPNLKLGER